MNVFSTFDTGVMVALLLGIEFLRSDIRTILYCKRNDPRILKSCLYTLLILLTSLYSIVAGAMLHPEPVPVYELIPGFQYGVYGFSFSFILLAVACLYRKTLPFCPFGLRYDIITIGSNTLQAIPMNIDSITYGKDYMIFTDGTKGYPNV